MPINKRSIALLGHSSSGKTSLAEAILYKAGATARLGSVNSGNTVSDYSQDEIDRKISINASALYADWNNTRVFILDTPGYADFVAEAHCSLRVVEAAILLIDAVSGVQVGSERAWKLIQETNLPVIIFINKLDKENASFSETLQAVQERFDKRCLPFDIPDAEGPSYKESINILDKDKRSALSGDSRVKADKFYEQVMEAAAETDDTLLEKYLDKGEISDEEFRRALRDAVIQSKIFPVLCGSASGDIGVRPILDAIVELLPAPDERAGIEAQDADTKEAAGVKVSKEEPFSAFVFKTIMDPYVGQLNLFKVFSGLLASNTAFYNVTKDGKERIGQLYYLQGKEQRATERVEAGDIAAVAKLKNTSTGDSISAGNRKVIFPPLAFPEPAISRSIKPRTKKDEEKISEALHRLAAEDLTFKVGRDPQTKEQIISGIGDLHITIMVERLKKRFGVDVDIGTPKVAYKETIKKSAKAQGKYKRQTGGRGQYGDCWIEIEPLDKGKGFEFVDKIVGGAIPRNYIPSVEKGIAEALQNGIIAGYPVVDIRVTLFDGSYHTVDSSDMAFKIAGSMAFKNAASQANPILLEPIMDVEVVIPEEFMGDITGDLNSRRGRVMGMESSSGGMQTIMAKAPIAELATYANELRSLTGGKGSYSMKFSHYEEVPHKIAQGIIQKYQQEKAESVEHK